MFLNEEKNPNYKTQKETMPGKIMEKLFNLIVYEGKFGNKELEILYENTTNRDPNASVRKQKEKLYKHFLPEDENVRRDADFLKYIIINEPNFHPRLETKLIEIEPEQEIALNRFKNKNIGIPLEPDARNRIPLKVRTQEGKKHRLMDCLKGKCWDSRCLLRIKGSDKSGKTTEINAFYQFCKKIGITKIIKIDFKYSINKTTIEDAGAFMNRFMDLISEQVNFNDDNYKNKQRKRIDYDPCNGSFEYTKKIVENVLSDPEDEFLIIIIDDVDELLDRFETAKIFYRYLRQVFENLPQIRIVITYSTDCYYKLNDWESPFNVGECLTVCGLDIEDIKELLKKNNTGLSDQNLNSLRAWIGASPYLWQIAIHYIKEEKYYRLSERIERIERIEEKIKFDRNVQGFFNNICKVIEKDFTLQSRVIELLENENLEESEIGPKYSSILEGLGVTKRSLTNSNKWKISSDIYKYFLKANLAQKKTKKLPNYIFNFSNISISDSFNFSDVLKNLRSIFKIR